MNLILLFDSDFITPTRVRLTDRRLEHIKEILKAKMGQELTVGKANDLMGHGVIIEQKNDYVELEVKFDKKPPKILPLTLILALPRPPMLKRILFSAAMLGLKKIIILNFNRVEKSLWNSSALKDEAIKEQLVLGLEQAKDTVLPEVILKKRFKPFVEDELPGLIKGKLALVAHPEKVVTGTTFLIDLKKSCACHDFFLIIGPEGGILDYEIDFLKSAGCQTIDLGPRIIRTEFVLPYVIGKLF